MRESPRQAMHEHDQPKTESSEPAAAPPAARALPAGMALQRAVGNRAMGQILQRMEVADAVDSLEKAMGAGVMGAERVVADTLTAFSSNASDFDKVAIEYQKKTEHPM